MFVEIEFDQLKAAPLGTHAPFGESGGRKTVDSPPILTMTAGVRRGCSRR